MDAIEVLKKDHRTVEDLFKRFNDGGGLTGMVKRLTGNGGQPRQRRQIAEKICAELDTHALIEEQVFYPAIRGLHDPELDKQLDEAEKEHSTIKQRCRAVRSAGDAEQELREAVSKLQECVDHHVGEEEREMFPMVEDRMPDDERDRVGRELTARKRSAPKPAKPTPSARPAARGRAANPRARATKKAGKRGGASRGRRVKKTAAKTRKRTSTAKKKASGGRRR
jgi:iron-sulfur cluster repair protein YtfE (RIC family)